MKKIFRVAPAFLVLLFLGMCVFVVFSHMRPIFSRNTDIIGRILAAAVLLGFSLWARRSKHFKMYWPVLFAFFISLLAISVDYYLPSSQWLLSFLRIPIQTPTGLALDKLDSSIIIIGSIILLTKISGEKLSSVYLDKGNIRKSLSIGIVAFVISVLGSVFVAGLFGAQNLSLARIIPWIPWILIFIFGNALNEELLFRGLFLKKMEPLVGRFVSNLVIAIPFVLHHTGVTYTNDALIFLAYL